MVELNLVLTISGNFKFLSSSSIFSCPEESDLLNLKVYTWNLSDLLNIIDSKSELWTI